MDGTVALLADASTLPVARRAGLQAALIAHRVAVAVKLGVETIVAALTSGSTSGGNLVRAALASAGIPLGCWRLREPARADR